MTDPTTVNINGIRYIRAKEAELNFWVAFFGIATGVILGILLLRSFFQVTLAEQTVIETTPYEQEVMLEAPLPYDSQLGGTTV